MNNRILKFRAWDKATGRMYPEFSLFGETTCFDLVGQWLMEFPLGKTSLERMNDVEVMQFTGLKDRDGKGIFEGDILKMGAKKGVVSFFQGAFFIDEELLFSANVLLAGNISVLGNVFQNNF